MIDALKTQLVDYKAMTSMLQGQLRRGKNKSGGVSAGGAGGGAAPSIISGPPGRITYGGGGGPEGSVMESGEWLGGALDSSIGVRQSTAQASSGNRIR